MQRFLEILRSVLEALASGLSSPSHKNSRGSRGSGRQSTSRGGGGGYGTAGTHPTPASSQRKRTSASVDTSGRDLSPGQAGESATVEVDPRSLGSVVMGYQPQRDGAPDPGEVVWTWIPYEERDGRGKDRPVLVIAELSDDRSVVVSLTSHEHSGADYVSVGSGGWDSRGRPSWAVLDRVFLVRDGGVRREAAAIDPEVFAQVANALSSRYGWTSAR